MNLKHLDHLYADVEIAGKEMGIVHIYSTFPDYRYDVEPKEGFTCVDDVSRAVVLLSREWRRQPDAEMLRKLRRMVEFLLHMQHDNGYFNNFLWGDLSTNRDYQTSVAELNWWSFRALWALEEAQPILASTPSLGLRMQAATTRVVANLVRDLAPGPRRMSVAGGMAVPTWLPAGSGADQAGEAIVALLPHWRRTGSAVVRQLIVDMAEGIVLMQKGDAKTFPHGLFLSWRNHWHAWGNVQAYALLKAGEAFGRTAWLDAALVEVEHAYPWLLAQGFAESIEFRQEGARVREVARRRHPQIAYGLRPMVFAATAAHAVTKDAKYHQLALDLGAWLSGRNDGGEPVYDPATGRVLDGLVAPGQYNRNSGAESTIEALLSIQALRDGAP